ncbi:DUF7553 family protein [Halegenticoccus tardaugens]|uniref:DUF7553 family protein n=1 Tax=Halegenticoccus tardaugens TaxID=2071624 RepID=UPI00100A4E77|nr:hypothetical protein [Halegenticoccus tardaugens]
MTREELQTASEELRQASERVDGEMRERLYDQSNQLAELATAERGPDHGRLDRHMNVLHELAGELDGEAKAHVESAREHVTEYRKTVEGV